MAFPARGAGALGVPAKMKGLDCSDALLHKHKGAGQWPSGSAYLSCQGLAARWLSPLLFVLVMEVLNAMIHEAD